MLTHANMLTQLLWEQKLKTETAEREKSGLLCLFWRRTLVVLVICEEARAATHSVFQSPCWNVDFQYFVYKWVYAFKKRANYQPLFYSILNITLTRRQLYQKFPNLCQRICCNLKGTRAQAGGRGAKTNINAVIMCRGAAILIWWQI